MIGQQAIADLLPDRGQRRRSGTKDFKIGRQYLTLLQRSKQASEVWGIDVDGKAQPVRRNLLKTTEKLPVDCAQSSHSTPLISGQCSCLVYAWKPLNDKGSPRTGAARTFCYTWHTPRRPGVSIVGRKDLAERC